MKKHIIIAGETRAGKTTISQRISKTYGYQHISMDSIIAGLERIFPETGINSEADISPIENLYHISAKMAPFIRTMIDSGEYDEVDYGMVIDIYQLLPQDYALHIDNSICDIFYFVTADVTPQERFNLIKKYDTPRDYHFHMTDHEIMNDCISIVEISKLLKEQCKQFSLPCYETSKNRNDVIEKFINSIR